MLGKISPLFNPFCGSRVSIDLGTVNTLIYVKGRGIVINEPSVVAMRGSVVGQQPKIIAVGREANDMVGRTPDQVTAIKPMCGGVIGNYYAAWKMLEEFMDRVNDRRFFRFGSKTIVCAPCCATQVERRIIRESVAAATNGKIYLIDEPIAAAVGADVDISGPSGSMIVDIGGGTTDVAVISLNGIVCSRSIKVGGSKFDESIISYVKMQYGILIGEATAEYIKQKIGIAHRECDNEEITVRGRSIHDGIPCNFVITSYDVMDALEESLLAIIDTIMDVLSNTPPELSSDISEKGMVLTGGGSLLVGLDMLISETTGLEVRIADDPLTCVARGGGKLLDLKNIDEFFSHDNTDQ